MATLNYTHMAYPIGLLTWKYFPHGLVMRPLCARISKDSEWNFPSLNWPRRGTATWSFAPSTLVCRVRVAAWWKRISIPKSDPIQRLIATLKMLANLLTWFTSFCTKRGAQHDAMPRICWHPKIASNLFFFFLDWGRYFDRNFLRFSTIFGDKMAFFSKTNAMIHFLQNSAVYL
jgi:hypothetical protein